MPSKTIFSKPICMLVLILLINLNMYLILPSVLAHDEINEATDTEIAPKGKLNIRGAKTSNLKVIVKYPSQLPKERLLMEILLKDLTSDQPITGVNITAIFNSTLEKDAPQIKPLFINVLPTEAVGNYLAEVIFPKSGRYKLTLLMSKPGLNAQIIIPNIIIAENIPIAIVENQANKSLFATNYLGIIVIILAIVIILISLWVIKEKMPRKSRH